MGFLRRHRTAIASSVVLAVGATALVAFALASTGYPVRQVDLDDGGIWVTSDRDGLFGRLNRPAGALDAAFYPPGGTQQTYQLDIVQDGAAVVARDAITGRLFPVDVARAVALPEQGLSIAAETKIAMAGGTLAALDPKTGRVWATRVDTRAGMTNMGTLDPNNAPVAAVDGVADFAVGVDGTVRVVAESGKTATIRPTEGDFENPDYAALPHPLRSVQVTSVGGDLVVLDAEAGKVVLPDGRDIDVGADEQARVQVPGPGSDVVVLATSKALITVGIEGGQVGTLSEVGAGPPAAPVRLGDCVHAAWSKTPSGYVSSCFGAKAAPGGLRDEQALVKPVFRVNRGAVVLNDLATGAVWDLTTRRKVDDWSAVKPPPVLNPSDKTKNDKNTDAANDKPPKAVDDTLGARPGRTTVLHVLDNDSDPAGNILSISAITAPDNPAVALAVAPDGQSVQVTMPESGVNTRFKYTVDDGKGLNATASVNVESRGADDNKPPELRAGYKPREWSVPSSGTLSLPALGEWRDFDGDPIVLADAKVDAGAVTTTPAGFVEFAAPKQSGTQKVGYRVTDGRSEPVPGTEAVTVQEPTATNAVAAVAEPDVARGQVGRPITVRPLENDRPGSDPTDPAARVRLAGDLAAPPGAAVVTDLKTGLVTVTVSRPGTVFLEYSAAFGNAPFAQGSIRIDATAAPDTPLPPVAVPDTAVVRAQLPTLVDVLANDVDPSGSLLVVQTAEAARDDQLKVAIVKGRWLRITALTPALSPNPQVVRYTVTNGLTGAVTGEVSVTQLGPPADDTPVPKDDYAVVRAGDSVAIPVLDNDTTPGGSPISLQANVEGAPARGKLSVTGLQDPGKQVGDAFVTGNVVRYVPPSSVDAPVKVAIDYVALNPNGDQAVGHAHVTITPAPTPSAPNQAPAPQLVEARAVAGDTIKIVVPTTGLDPDGDSVTVTGIGSASALGRVIAIGATSITYQAYPTSAGTDSFGYVVTDPYGKSAESQVRVAIVPPGDPQPAVAVDDVVTAAPGIRLAIDVLANDLRAPGDTVRVGPLAERNPGLPPDVSLNADTGLVELTAPELTGKPLVVSYASTGGFGEASIATLTVRSQKDYNVPPIAGDTYANPGPGAGTVEVDVLAAAGDVDGAPEDLTVPQVFDPKATVSGGKITIPVLDQPRTVAYEVRDGGGASALGLVHVPAAGNGAPYGKAEQSIEVPADGSKTVSIADYVVDPAGKPVKLTLTERISASPSIGLKVRNEGDQGLVLTAVPGYNGPAAVTFQVTNGTLTEGTTAYITVPVQVGPDVPILRCPNGPITLIAGGTTVGMNITSVCHVWTAKPGGAADLKYTARWKAEPGGVDIAGQGSGTIRLTASGAARPGANGVLEVGVDGSPGAPTPLTVRVIAVPAPSVSPVSIDGVKAGETAVVDVSAYVRSRLRDPVVSVLSVRQVDGMSASSTSDGSTVRITPGGDAHGSMSFEVTVTDVADRNRNDRKVPGRITLRVLGVPDAPGTPVPGRTTLSKVVELSWTTPANNGAPIETYEVGYDGGTQSCAGSPCSITGLTNGREYSFSVKARNLVGWGKPSGRSAGAKPDEVPGAVGGLTASRPQDGSVLLDWTPPKNEGSAVTRYEITWTGGGRTTASSGATSATASGLDNDTVYTFTVVAVNAEGPGPATSTTGQSAGAPSRPNAPTFTAAQSADQSSRAVQVSWGAVSANGPGPVTYTVQRTGGGRDKTVCRNATATSCADDGLANDGTIYTYTVTASNSAPGEHVSAPSPGAQMEATATPDPFGAYEAEATGVDGQAKITFDAPASHGRTNTVTCSWGGGNSCGTWTFPPDGRNNASYTINGLPNGELTKIALRTCNGSGGGAYAGDPCNVPASQDVTAYGPMKDLVVTTSTSGKDVNWSISVNANGKPATVRVQTDDQDVSFETGVGVFTKAGKDTLDYNKLDTIKVTVTDKGRPTLTETKTQKTGPPPPAPAVTVTKGANCANACGSDPAACTDASCAYIKVQTANFLTAVNCSFSADKPGTFVNENFNPNETRQTRNFYGSPGTKVYVTCGGVPGSMIW
ncbi:Ig-like domain-containing protein [Actinokineospora sp. NBRC 105648]|uniref:Ig-like domain-containing protein n=1 Tax=Actinokineospora sp. NBRC 105648 TaxID=3032206 RepID=UPI0024A57D76|nr:Ig-like domain-containing protein [Actinokineospora sp. NBRC 105648]GLZ40410.1 fibronectin type III [Actinokineospora sp. NBRC 105648]